MGEKLASVQEPGIREKSSGQMVSSTALSQFQKFRHGSTTRNFRPDCSTRLDEIRSAAALLDNPGAFIAYGEQKHTNNVVVVSTGDLETQRTERSLRYPETDSLVTNCPNVALAIQTADCAPLFLIDPKAQVMGLAHGGWKGTLARIAERTVETMVTLGASPADIFTWVGPMAGACCYEVSDDLITAFRDEFDELSPALVHQGRNLNLVEITAQQLLRTGIPESQIFRSNICTIHQHDQFFSYRADHGTTGRILSLMLMLED